MNDIKIYRRLFEDYTKLYLNKIILAAFFSILVAASTSATAWLLDPAIKKLFIEKDQSLILIIPLLIILAFFTKGISLYFAKTNIISISEGVKKKLQYDMVKSLIVADLEIINKKHSGKFISNLTYDVNHITDSLSIGMLNIFKDSLTLIGLLLVMFFQNWKLSLIALIIIPLASFISRILGKRIRKVTSEAQEKSGFLTTYLVELFKNHKLIKIFQKEAYEKERANDRLNQLKDKSKKIQFVYTRLSPIMETLTGVMIAILIFYSSKLVANNELDVNNFFSFLAAMMLAYQPVRALSNLTMVFKQGLSAASRILPIIDQKNLINPGSDGLPFWEKIEGCSPDELIYDGQEIKLQEFSFTVLHTPGHSFGSCCFYFKKEDYLFSGDTLFQGTYGNISFPTSEPKKMKNSLHRLSTLPKETVVFPGHGLPTIIEEEKWLLELDEKFFN